MISQLYSHYGSRLTTGTSEFLYDALLADEALAPFFENVDMDALRTHMADFIGALTGGPEIYKGRPMDEAHKPYHITPYHFQRVAHHLHDALLAAGISQDDTTAIMTEVAKLRASVVNASQPQD